MTIWNLGSINADHVYSVPHIPEPGETLAATGLNIGLGGKGANMSVACARAGAHVAHVGAVGSDGAWAVERLMEYGVDTREIETVTAPTGHAIINVDAAAENAIVILPGANAEVPLSRVQSALGSAATGDWFLTQNETNCQAEAMQIARDLGLRTAYAAAPFEAKSVEAVLDLLDLLILNEVEAAQLAESTGIAPGDLPIKDVVITLGGDGVRWHGAGEAEHIPARKVTPVDTTGAGDTFTGYLLACLDRGQPMKQALNWANIAGSLMVMRPGAADVIPDLSEVQAELQAG